MEGSSLKKENVWQLTIHTAPEAEEAVSELINRVFQVPPSVFTNLEKASTTVTSFTIKGAGFLDAKRAEIEQGLLFIESCGLAVAPGKITIERVKREDWSESWKKHFKTIRVGKALVIKPSWSKERIARGIAEVILDPGLSFGTGQHPTTSYCLEELVKYRGANDGPTFLDMGCGSGILAIAAVKLGYETVRAFDFDPVAVRVAQANAKRNRAEKRLQVMKKDLTRLPNSFAKQNDVICANLMYDLLISEAEKISSRLADEGHLILAGILKTQFSDVRRAYEQQGLRLIRQKGEREWRSGTFAWTPK